MARRGLGLGALQNQQQTQAKFKEKGLELAKQQLAQMTQQMETFKKNLQEFAAIHRQKIQKSPEFRTEFTKMCAAIGVDPLASSKGFWAETLGVGDFYYELAIKIVEICLANSSRTGGLMEVEEIRRRLTAGKSRFETYSVTTEDVLRALRCLNVLGNGFTMINVGGRVLVQSVPAETNNADHSAVLEAAAGSGGRVTREQLMTSRGWTAERAQVALHHFVREGLAWVDDQFTLPERPSERFRAYWFPSLISSSTVLPGQLT